MRENAFSEIFVVFQSKVTRKSSLLMGVKVSKSNPNCDLAWSGTSFVFNSGLMDISILSIRYKGSNTTRGEVEERRETEISVG